MAIVLSRALSRSLAIAKLDVPTFEEVEHDTSCTPEAGAVAIGASIIGSVGSLFLNGLWGFIASIIVLIVGWFIWAWLSAFIAKQVFDVQTTDTGEMLRTTGYAYAPRVIGIVPLLGLVGIVWSIVAIVVGMRQAGEMTTIQAVITTLIGALPALIGVGLVAALIT